MRLLERIGDDEVKLTCNFISNVPAYAILSHTWDVESEEVSYSDLLSGLGKNKRGYRKVQFCGNQAARHGLRYFWIDSCCIDRSSSAELTEAINSMFRWYQNAARCYVFLSDVPQSGHAVGGSSLWPTCEADFLSSRWFTRGWTLQELLAPRSVEFFSKTGEKLGDKRSLEKQINDATGIALRALRNEPLLSFSVSERMLWAANRNTTREEDKAYSLLGIFDVTMPSIYGEGEEKAVNRLLKKLNRLPKEPGGNIYWRVPRAISSLFLGRFETLDRIQRALSVDETTNVADQKRYVITGLGGVGKSEVCLKVANLMRESFWGVFWVDVGSPSTAESDFKAIAKLLGSPAESINEALDLLSNSKKRWLLILDNADDPDFDYQTYLSSGVYGSVIITSRIRGCSQYSTVGCEELGGLELEDSTKLLLTAAKISPEFWPDYNHRANSIVELLGSHTLALIQAGSYVAEGFCDLNQYPEVYRLHRRRLHNEFPNQARSRYGGVYATFEASAEVLQNSMHQKEADALSLLGILSVLHSGILPLSVFEQAWKGSRTVLRSIATDENDEAQLLTEWHLSKLPAFLAIDIGSWDGYRLKRAASILAHLSLITLHQLSGSSGVSMHPLAHAWAKDRLNEQQQRTTKLSVGCLIAFMSLDDFILRLNQRELAPHLQCYLYPGYSFLLKLEHRDKMLPIILGCGRAFFHLYDIWSLPDFINTVDSEFSVELATITRKYLPVFNLKASFLLYSDQNTKAVELLEGIKDIYDKTAPGSNLAMLSSCDLSLVYLALGKNKEAIRLLEPLVNTIDIVQLQADDIRLNALHILGRAYYKARHMKETIELLGHLVRVREHALVETDPNRLSAIHELSVALLEDGQIKEALKLLQHVVEVQCRTMVETHPQRLASQRDLAVALVKDGQVEKAIELLQRLIEALKLTFVETHPEQLYTQYILAQVLLAGGRVEGAVELLEHVVRLRESTTLETDSNLLEDKRTLAKAYGANGDTKKSLLLLEKVVSVEGTTLEETNLTRLTSQHQLALAYRKSGQVEKAREILQHVVDVEKTILKETSTSRLMSQYALALIYWENGQVEEARLLVQHVVRIRQAIFPEHHPDRLESERLLALVS